MSARVKFPGILRAFVRQRSLTARPVATQSAAPKVSAISYRTIQPMSSASAPCTFARFAAPQDIFTALIDIFSETGGSRLMALQVVALLEETRWDRQLAQVAQALGDEHTQIDRWQIALPPLEFAALIATLHSDDSVSQRDSAAVLRHAARCFSDPTLLHTAVAQLQNILLIAAQWPLPHADSPLSELVRTLPCSDQHRIAWIMAQPASTARQQLAATLHALPQFSHHVLHYLRADTPHVKALTELLLAAPFDDRLGMVQQIATGADADMVIDAGLRRILQQRVIAQMQQRVRETRDGDRNEALRLEIFLHDHLGRAELDETLASSSRDDLAELLWGEDEIIDAFIAETFELQNFLTFMRAQDNVTSADAPSADDLPAPVVQILSTRCLTNTVFASHIDAIVAQLAHYYEATSDDAARMTADALIDHTFHTILRQQLAPRLLAAMHARTPAYAQAFATTFLTAPTLQTLARKIGKLESITELLTLLCTRFLALVAAAEKFLQRHPVPSHVRAQFLLTATVALRDDMRPRDLTSHFSAMLTATIRVPDDTAGDDMTAGLSSAEIMARQIAEQYRTQYGIAGTEALPRALIGRGLAEYALTLLRHAPTTLAGAVNLDRTAHQHWLGVLDLLRTIDTTDELRRGLNVVIDQWLVTTPHAHAQLLRAVGWGLEASGLPTHVEWDLGAGMAGLQLRSAPTPDASTVRIVQTSPTTKISAGQLLKSLIASRTGSVCPPAIEYCAHVEVLDDAAHAQMLGLLCTHDGAQYGAGIRILQIASDGSPATCVLESTPLGRATAATTNRRRLHRHCATQTTLLRVERLWRTHDLVNPTQWEWRFTCDEIITPDTLTALSALRRCTMELVDRSTARYVFSTDGECTTHAAPPSAEIVANEIEALAAHHHWPTLRFDEYQSIVAHIAALDRPEYHFLRNAMEQCGPQIYIKKFVIAALLETRFLPQWRAHTQLSDQTLQAFQNYLDIEAFENFLADPARVLARLQAQWSEYSDRLHAAHAITTSTTPSSFENASTIENAGRLTLTWYVELLRAADGALQRNRYLELFRQNFYLERCRAALMFQLPPSVQKHTQPAQHFRIGLALALMTRHEVVAVLTKTTPLQNAVNVVMTRCFPRYSKPDGTCYVGVELWQQVINTLERYGIDTQKNDTALQQLQAALLTSPLTAGEQWNLRQLFTLDFAATAIGHLTEFPAIADALAAMGFGGMQ